MFNAISLDDPREILSVGFVDIAAGDLAAATANVSDQEAVRHSRIDEVIESTILHGYYDLRSEHDFSSDLRCPQEASSSTPTFVAPVSSMSLWTSAELKMRFCGCSSNATGATGSERIYDGWPDVALDLIEARTFDGRSQLLDYRPRLLDAPLPAGPGGAS